MVLNTTFNGERQMLIIFLWKIFVFNVPISHQKKKNIHGVVLINFFFFFYINLQGTTYECNQSMNEILFKSSGLGIMVFNTTFDNIMAV